MAAEALEMQITRVQKYFTREFSHEPKKRASLVLHARSEPLEGWDLHFSSNAFVLSSTTRLISVVANACFHPAILGISFISCPSALISAICG